MDTKKDTLHAGKHFAFRRGQKEGLNRSNSNSNQINIPQAKQVMEQFKIQTASEASINLQSGHLPSHEAGDLSEDGREKVSRKNLEI